MPLLLFCGVSAAALLPIDFQEELQAHTASKVSHLRTEKGIEMAVQFGDAFRKEVFNGVSIQYELALILNQNGDLDKAYDRYTEILAGDPDHVPSLYDRGEILLLQGEYEAASVDLRKLLSLRPEEWVVHFRLAEIAGYQEDPSQMEYHILKALRHGFLLSSLVESGQHWHTWSKHPTLGLILKQIFLLYGSESLWLQLQQH
jgi:tetratricopeptide (TPR) repeat protein